jgi:predicted secreted protein
MNWPLGIALYFTIWWVVLFAVLPFGVRSQHEDGEMPEGTDPGAPVAPRMGIKMLWTTIVSAIVWAAALYVISRF